MTRITQYSEVNLYPEVVVDSDTWNSFPTPDIVEMTIRTVGKRGVKVIPVADSNEALSVVKKIIPPPC